MDAQIFLSLLASFSVLTSLVVEGIKKTKNDIPLNITVLIVAMLVGSIGTSIYYVFVNAEPNIINFIYMLLMGLANWLTAMVGYDKVKQSILQFTKK